MPYIKQEKRAELARFDYDCPGTCGDLNFLITRLCLRYINFKGKSYTNFNDVLGALEGAKLEMYRRAIGPYEDQKIKENGDVY